MRHLTACLAAFLCLGPTATHAQSSSGPVDVPMLQRGPEPEIEVMVNGKGPFVFAIDTGASGVGRADTSLVTALALSDVGEARGGDGSSSPTRAMKIVGVDTLTVGSLTRSHLELPSRDYNTAPNVPRIDGILGLGFFADQLLTLDFPSHRVRIETGELPPANGADILGFDNARGVPMVDLVVSLAAGPMHVPTMLDTGNISAPLLVPASLADKLTFTAPPTVVGKAHTVTSEIEIKQGAVSETIALGGHLLSSASVTFPSVGESADLGPAALKDLVVTFDQKNKRVRITSPRSPV